MMIRPNFNINAIGPRQRHQKLDMPQACEKCQSSIKSTEPQRPMFKY